MYSLFTAILLGSPLSAVPGMSASAQSSAIDSEWGSYSNFFMGIKMSYPAEWRSDSEYLDFMHDVTFYELGYPANAPIYERFSVVVEKLPQGTDLQEYSDYLVDFIGQEEQFLALDDEDDYTLAGRDARAIVFRYFDQGLEADITAKMAWTVADNMAYVLSAYALPEDFDGRSAMFDAMFESFEITDTTPVTQTPSYHTDSGVTGYYVIQYPYTWSSVYDDAELEQYNSLSAFSSPWHGYMFNGASVYVQLYEISETITLSDYTEERIRGTEEFFESVEILESSDTQLSGRDAHRILYTWKTGDVQYKTLEVWSLVGSNAFHIIGEAEAEVFEDYVPVITHMIDTFKFEANAGDSNGSGGVSPPVDIDEVGYASYESSDYGISIKYPASWAKLEPEGLAVAFTSLPENDEDEYFETMVIGAVDSPVKISLSEYTKITTGSFRTWLDNVVIEESKPTTLDGYAAHYSIATGSNEGVQLRLYAVWTVVENRGYFLMFLAEREEYPRYTGVVEEMIESFQIDETKLETGYRLYRDESLGISLQHPGNWKIEKAANAVGVTMIDNSDYRYIITTAFPMIWNASLAEQAKLLPKMLSDGDETFRVVESTPITLAGYPGYKIVYTQFMDIPDTIPPEIQPVAYRQVADSVEIKTAAYMTARNGVVYTVAFGTSATGYLSYVNTITRIVESIEIDPTVVTRKVSREFIDPESSLRFSVPSGWTAYSISLGNRTGISMFSNSEDKATISVHIASIEETIKASETESPEQGVVTCDPIRESRIVQATADLKMQMSEQDCTIFDLKAKTMNYNLYTSEESILIGLLTSGDGAFENSLPALDSVISTVELDKAIDAFSSDRYDSLFGVTSMNQTVSALNSTYTLGISTTSNITDFRFDEPNKRITFKVTGESGTQGYSSIRIGDILTAPYTVTIDGNPSEEFTMTYDETSNETGIFVRYPHSTHEISITGTTVVPEFSSMAVMMLISAAVMAGALQFARSKGLGTGSSQTH